MYKIDQQSNQIIPLENQTFSTLGFRERDHLQEWLAKCPEALGEELLIIQKEFSGFDKTNERLDLLALDKNGQLVIIENKRDDSGKDVTGQALKYTAYCSTLSKQDIIDCYQDYLNKELSSPVSAEDAIATFLGLESMDEALLNEGNAQRIMIIAGNFRPEVTSTVLWLMEYGVRIQCFQAQLYTHQNECFFKLEQILPVPSTENMIVRKIEKEREQEHTKQVKKGLAQLFAPFWIELAKAFSDLDLPFQLPFEKSAQAGGQISVSLPVKDAYLEIVLTGKNVRIQFDPKGSHQSTVGAALYNWLKNHEQILSTEINRDVILTNKNHGSGRLSIDKSINARDPQNWPEIIQWLAKAMPSFQKAFAKRIPEIQAYLAAEGL